MTTRTTKPSLLYTLEAPAKWLQAALRAQEQYLSALCRDAWRSQLLPTATPARVQPRGARSLNRVDRP
jgi:hypothetical protein